MLIELLNVFEMIGLLVAFSTLLRNQNNDYAQSIDIDSKGNVFIAGYTYGLQKDIFIIKFNSDLSKILKTFTVSSSGNDIPFAISIDENDDVFVVGITDHSNEFLKNYDKVKYGELGSNDGFIIKISNDLDTIYKVAIIGSNFSDEIRDIKVTKYEVFVCGFTFNSSQFPNLIYYGKKGEADAFIIKLSKNLDTLYKTAIIASTSSELINDIELDKDGNVFAVGTLNSAFAEFSENRKIYGSAALEDIFVVKLSNNLDKLYKTAIIGSCITYNSYDFGLNRIYYGESGNADIFVSKLSNDLDTLYNTAIISSKGGESSVFGIHLVNNDLIVVFTSEDYKSVGGDTKREFCGNGGLKDILIAYMSKNLYDLKKILILTGSGEDDGCYYRGKCSAKFLNKVFVVFIINKLFDIHSYNFKNIAGNGNYNLSIFSFACLKGG